MSDLPQNVSPKELENAAARVRRGDLVAFPTETVYGLGADADNPVATAKIFAAKGRPADHPLIVHLANASQMTDWAKEIPAEAWKLAEAFWPGPLTLILKRSSRAHDGVTGGLPTVGLRVPSHPVAQALLKQSGCAIAAPSANRFGHVSPTKAEHVRAEFGAELPCILEGGDCQVGLESTIVDCSSEHLSILRPGGIAAAAIERVLQRQLVAPQEDSPACSGRLLSHYAPSAEVQLVASAEELAQRLSERSFTQAASPFVVLSVEKPLQLQDKNWIALPVQEEACAQQLYSALRQIDQRGASIALVFYPTSATGLGPAIADRLQKAAGPRSLSDRH